MDKIFSLEIIKDGNKFKILHKVHTNKADISTISVIISMYALKRPSVFQLIECAYFGAQKIIGTSPDSLKDWFSDYLNRCKNKFMGIRAELNEDVMQIIFNMNRSLEIMSKNIIEMDKTLSLILKNQQQMNQDVQNLINEVAQLKTVDQSVVAALKGFASQVQSGIDAQDLAAIQQTVTDVTGVVNDLSAAVTANTPAASTSSSSGQ